MKTRQYRPGRIRFTLPSADVTVVMWFLVWLDAVADVRQGDGE